MFEHDVSLVKGFFLRPVTSDGAIYKDRKDPEHAQQDTNTTTFPNKSEGFSDGKYVLTKDERNGSTFPWAKSHDGTMNTLEERFGLHVLHVMMMVAVVGAMGSTVIRQDTHGAIST